MNRTSVTIAQVQLAPTINSAIARMRGLISPGCASALLARSARRVGRAEAEHEHHAHQHRHHQIDGRPGHPRGEYSATAPPTIARCDRRADRPMTAVRPASFRRQRRSASRRSRYPASPTPAPRSTRRSRTADAVTGRSRRSPTARIITAWHRHPALRRPSRPITATGHHRPTRPQEFESRSARSRQNADRRFVDTVLLSHAVSVAANIAKGKPDDKPSASAARAPFRNAAGRFDPLCDRSSFDHSGLLPTSYRQTLAANTGRGSHERGDQDRADAGATRFGEDTCGRRARREPAITHVPASAYTDPGALCGRARAAVRPAPAGDRAIRAIARTRHGGAA